jgi:hypothetical protein
MTASVVDTNVAIAANGRGTHASEKCKLNCAQTLTRIVESEIISIDKDGKILNEYKVHLNRGGQLGIGFYFYLHIIDNQYDPSKVELVSITPTNDDKMYQEFPSDPALAGFDSDDRKFVAVALASENNPIIQNALKRD